MRGDGCTIPAVCAAASLVVLTGLYILFTVEMLLAIGSALIFIAVAIYLKWPRAWSRERRPALVLVLVAGCCFVFLGLYIAEL